MYKQLERFPNYIINEYGTIINQTTGKELSQCTDSDGYKVLHLYNQGKPHNLRVHRLVAETFLDNPNNLPQVNHKDEDKGNNHISNLEWCTQKYNSNYGTKNQKHSEKVVAKVGVKIKGTNIKTGEEVYYNAIKHCGRDGFHYPNVLGCLKGRLKTHKGYIWSYCV